MKKKELVNVVFDRRKLYAKRGMAYLEVMVYLGRKGRRYITVCTSTPLSSTYKCNFLGADNKQ